VTRWSRARTRPTLRTTSRRARSLARALTGAGYVVSWDTITGRVYTLREAAPIDAIWSNVAGYASVTGTGTRVGYTNPSPPNVKFHSLRVRKVNP